MNTNPKAKRVLIFGDSITWGYVSGSKHQRMRANIRYPGVLQDILGDEYEIIEEALNSRGIVNGDPRPGKEGRSATEYILPCLDSHDPLDVVVVLLGTNELKNEYNNSIKQIGEYISDFIKLILNRKSQFRDTTPSVILLSPPIVDETTAYCKENNKYFGATEKSKNLAKIYKDIAEKLETGFLDTSNVSTTGIDGIHITEESHKNIAIYLAKSIRSLQR